MEETANCSRSQIQDPGVATPGGTPAFRFEMGPGPNLTPNHKVCLTIAPGQENCQ
jgi:hypothetical protein